MLLFRLILTSLKQLSRDIINDTMMKQSIFDVNFKIKQRISKISLKKDTAETSWEIIVFTSYTSLNPFTTPSLFLSLSIYI